jgi:hypothetical protein
LAWKASREDASAATEASIRGGRLCCATALPRALTHFRQHWRPSKRIYIYELLDLVSSNDGGQKTVDDAVTHLYDWHNGRLTTSLQLSKSARCGGGSSDCGEADIVARPAIGAAGVFAAVALALIQFFSLVWLPRKYIYALRLAMRVR